MPIADVCRLFTRPVRVISILVAACTLALGWWFARGIEVPLPSVTAPELQRIPSVTPEQIEADLRLLKTRTDCIRTYGLTQGLDAVPAVAHKLGMRVKLGVWLARDATQNQSQLSRGLALARQYPNVIDLLILGNEVLLRKEMTPPQLAQILQAAKVQSPVPISYADVWEFWERNAALAAHVDVVTVHILPYWEDQPVAVDTAAQHVQEIGRKMQRHFGSKPVWIGETGWPAAGRQRDGAVPGKVAQTAFLRDLLLQRSYIGQNFNVIEAFDQPWKRSFEGAMGGYWGLFDAQGQERVSFKGAVTEDPNWWRGLVWAGAVAALGVLLVGFAHGWHIYPLLIGALGGAMLGTVWATQLLMSTWWDRSSLELAVSMGLSLVGTACVLACLAQVIRGDAFAAEQNRASDVWARIADAACLAVLFCAASAALVLVLDPRYRPFPWWWFLAPTASWMAWRCAAPTYSLHRSRQIQFLACALAVSAVGLMLQEGWRNTQALAYGALLLSLAGAAAWPRFANTNAANKAAGALSSVQ
jgi:exo-beta-1,3-glucanase (GH17 family)